MVHKAAVKTYPVLAQFPAHSSQKIPTPHPSATNITLFDLHVLGVASGRSEYDQALSLKTAHIAYKFKNKIYM